MIQYLKKRKYNAIASILVGILSLTTIPLPFLALDYKTELLIPTFLSSIPLGITAILLGLRGEKSEKEDTARIGVILGSLGLIVGLLALGAFLLIGLFLWLLGY